MKKALLCILSILLIGCDCIQQVEGYIIDDSTERSIGGVKIWKEQRPTHVDSSDDTGFFHYQGISGGFRKCADITLVFEKVGYKRLEKTFPAFRLDTVEIRLEKTPSTR